MTHAECQDLLLDLAYGELDAARAADVQSHLAGCDDCQRDQAQIAQARRMASPLRSLEEPSARFDGRILAAARAEASLQSDGLPGQVIEVKGSVSPMGLQAARIDSLAAVKAAPRGRKPNWVLRVALGGSVAAAAALALVMSTTLQSRKAEQPAAAQYEIRVGRVAEKAQREAISRAEEAKKPAPAEPAPAPVAAAVPPPVKEEPRPVAEKKLAAKAKAIPREDPSPLAGSGGDAADALALRGSATQGVAAGGAMGAMGPAASHGAEPAASVAAPAPVTTPAALTPAAPAAALVAPPAVAPRASVVAPTRVAVNEGQADSPGGRVEMQRLAKASPAAAEEVNAGLLESRAQDARRSGNYTLAASNYRRAAALRQAADKDSGTAAWDLTHAVECLASAGLFDEARLVGAELLRLYPAESAAVSAANRALRPGDLPAAAQQQVKSAQPAEQQPAKARDEKRQDAATPAQH